MLQRDVREYNFQKENWKSELNSVKDGLQETFTHLPSSIKIETYQLNAGDMEFKVFEGIDFLGRGVSFVTDRQAFINDFIYNGAFVTYITGKGMKTY